MWIVIIVLVLLFAGGGGGLLQALFDGCFNVVGAVLLVAVLAVWLLAEGCS